MTDPHATDAPGHDDHGAGHGDEPLGPVDVAAWGAGLVGIAISLVIGACFVLATSGIG